MWSRRMHVKCLSVCCILAVGIIIYSAGKDLKYKPLPNSETDFDNENTFDIILNAYKHSGSTATGRILSKRSDTFYVHEPLWHVATGGFYKGPRLYCHDFETNGCIHIDSVCPNTTRTTRNVQPTATNLENSANGENGYQRTLKESIGFLQSILDCTFHQYSNFFLDKSIKSSDHQNVNSIFYHGVGWNEFKTCRLREGADFTDCLKEAEIVCKSLKHRVIKLLRITLDNLTPMLLTNTRLKVVQLFRDPRGILNSQMNPGWYSVDDEKFERVHKYVKTMCDRILTDIQASEMLKTVYPDRVKIIQYEHFYNAPLTDAAADLYKFAGMSFTKDQQQVIQTKFGNEQNSTAGFHPFNYRTKLPWKVIDLFNKDCSEVLVRLGYTRYNNETHLRDLEQSGFANANQC